MRMKLVAMILGVLVLSTVAAWTQEGRGTITGRVVDSSGALVAGAEVRAINQETRATASARSNDTGNYTLPYLLPGTYRLSAEFSGFKKTEKLGIEVRVNDVLSVEFALQVGSPSETVEVKGGAPLLESSNVSIGLVLDQRRIEELPVQAGNANEMALLAPGVVNTTNLRQRKTSFANASSLFVTDGNSLYSNEYTIDGVVDTFANNGTPLVAFQLPSSAVSEFKVQTGAFDASQGHTPGAVLNVVSKGGTNQYHGELHEWLINSALDASTFFQNRSGAAKPVYQDNRYGASLGGPVRLPKLYDGHNKTFFFYAWEANQWGKPTANVGTVPTAAEKSGDFSALLKQGASFQIYDPLTTITAANGRFTRTPFVGNIIPTARLDPVALKIQSYYAPPNTAGTSTGQSNYTRNTKDVFSYFVHFARMDHNFSEKHRIFARLHYDHSLESNANFYGNVANGLNLTRINRGAAVDDVIVLSPTTILNLRYGLTQEETPEKRRSSGFDLSSLGFSPQLLALTDPASATFPNVYLNTRALTRPCTGTCTGTFSGFANFQAGDGNTTGLIHNWAATVNTLHGNHNLRYGSDIRLYRSFLVAGGYDVSPGFQFLPTYTNGPNDNSTVASIGQEYAAFLLGIPAGQMNRSASYAIQNVSYGMFVQDDWKLTPRLTVNLGLRYEYETPVSERYDRAVRSFDRSSANPIQVQALANYAKSPIPQIPVANFRVLGGLQFAGAGNHSLWSGQNLNLLPRIGLAYQLDVNTVVRAGYGIFYDTIGVNRSPAIQSGFTAITPIQASIDNGLTYQATTANPFPSGLTAPRGTADGLATFLGQALTVYPTDRIQPYSQRWTLNVQRMLAKEFMLEVGYVGNKAIHLPVDRNLNATPNQYLSTSPVRDQATIDALSATVANPFFGLNSVSTKTIAVADLLRPYPQFGDITETQPLGYSWYHALQVRAEKRLSHGYLANFTYTWSKNMDANSFLNAGDAAVNRSISNYDRPHRASVSGIYELPFGRGRLLASRAPWPLEALIGGWQFNAIVTYQTGGPLSFGDALLIGNFKDIPLPSDKRSVDRWFNTSVFNRVLGDQRASAIRLFPKYLAGVRGDGQTLWNLSLAKHFRFRERMKLEFRAECYDTLNHPNFNDPNTNVTSATFGTVTGLASGVAREFQGALKLRF